MRNGSLWSDIVFEKEVIFQEFDFETSDLEFEVSKSSIWKHTTSCDEGVFLLSLLSRNSDDQSSSNVHKFVILCICWDTPSEKTGLWQLPIVSNVFKRHVEHFSTEVYTTIITGFKIRHSDCRGALCLCRPANICISEIGTNLDWVLLSHEVQIAKLYTWGVQLCVTCDF